MGRFFDALHRSQLIDPIINDRSQSNEIRVTCLCGLLGDHRIAHLPTLRNSILAGALEEHEVSDDGKALGALTPRKLCLNPITQFDAGVVG